MNNENEEILDEEEKDEEIEELTDDSNQNDDYEEEEDYEEIPHSSNRDKEQLQVKMFKLFGILIVVIILIVVVFYLFKSSSKKKYTYEDVENILVTAATNYFEDNKKELPRNYDSVVEIRDRILISHNYMKEISEYIPDGSCSGKVLVRKYESNNYSYTPYLDCKDSYKTQKLYDVVMKNGKVDDNGYGLYKINNEYVFRGKEVKNYLKFRGSDYLWRIIKIDKNGDFVLITEEKTVNTYPWDTRYNSNDNYTSGINTFNKSDISETLKIMYSGNYDKNEEIEYLFKGENIYFDKEQRQKLVSYESCVGPRSENDSSRDGSTECKVVEEVKVGLLPIYDYLNASLDKGCVKTSSDACQNYNYLADGYTYWLANGDASNTYKVFYMASSRTISSKSADNSNFIKLVIHIDKETVMSKGKGTREKPYVIN